MCRDEVSRYAGPKQGIKSHRCNNKHYLTKLFCVHPIAVCCALVTHGSLHPIVQHESHILSTLSILVLSDNLHYVSGCLSSRSTGCIAPCKSEVEYL